MPDPQLSLFRKPTSLRAAFGSRRKTEESTQRAFLAFSLSEFSAVRKFSLGIVKGTAVNLIADGADEATAVDTLSELIASDFTE